jgi:hypothetical protein
MMPAVTIVTGFLGAGRRVFPRLVDTERGESHEGTRDRAKTSGLPLPRSKGAGRSPRGASTGQSFNPATACFKASATSPRMWRRRAGAPLRAPVTWW